MVKNTRRDIYQVDRIYFRLLSSVTAKWIDRACDWDMLVEYFTHK